MISLAAIERLLLRRITEVEPWRLFPLSPLCLVILTEIVVVPGSMFSMERFLLIFAMMSFGSHTFFYGSSPRGTILQNGCFALRLSLGKLLILLFMLFPISLPVHAAQISPNPNNGTINVSGTDYNNDVPFNNNGTINVDVSGTLTTNSTLNNNGAITNNGLITYNSSYSGGAITEIANYGNLIRTYLKIV